MVFRELPFFIAQSGVRIGGARRGMMNYDGDFFNLLIVGLFRALLLVAGSLFTLCAEFCLFFVI